MSVVSILTAAICTTHLENVYAADSSSSSVGSLYAGYAALVDADTGRLLYGKNADTQVPMASTTKIMTCIIALEYAPLDLECTASSYAASMPEVKLYVTEGERFVLGDLLYSLMLKSHNDSAVVIAENVAAYYLTECGQNPDEFSSKELVAVFSTLMNEKASSLGTQSTYYITPNGLDATDSTGSHSTTAYELALVMAYCIENDTFLEITQTKEYSFSSSKRSYTVTNANTFASLYPNIISGKTGYTALAGYCYVCAYRDSDRTLIAVVLASGWPYNKSYRWADTKKLLDYGRNNYTRSIILHQDETLQPIVYRYGFNTKTINPYLEISEDVSAILRDDDKINIIYNYKLENSINICAGDTIGSADIYINDLLWQSVAIKSDIDCSRADYMYYFKYCLLQFTH